MFPRSHASPTLFRSIHIYLSGLSRYWGKHVPIKGVSWGRLKVPSESPVKGTYANTAGPRDGITTHNGCRGNARSWSVIGESKVQDYLLLLLNVLYQGLEGDSLGTTYCESAADGTVNVVLGAQWGDEGKGKLVDLLSAEYDICARVAGGSNAGHTIIVDVGVYIAVPFPALTNNCCHVAVGCQV